MEKSNKKPQKQASLNSVQGCMLFDFLAHIKNIVQNKTRSLSRKDAFSLAEMIMILLFVAILALGSGIILPKKLKKADPQTPHGLYACTVFNNQEYYFSSTSKNAEIPAPGGAGWKLGNCQKNFKVPKYVNLLNVTMIGGGGAGKDASVTWDKESKVQDGDLGVNGDKYYVEYDGWYTIYLFGQYGESSWRSEWDLANGGCNVAPAQAGYPYRVQGEIQLKRGDVIQLYKEEKTPNTGTNFFCADNKHRPGKDEYYKGKDGGKTALLLNGAEFVSVNGSKAGVTVCSSTNPPNCTNRYTVTRGANGTLGKATGMSDILYMDPSTNAAYQNYPSQDGVASIRYSTTKNSSTREFTPSGGCGGSAGQTSATLYPVLRDTIPSITIGIGGTPTRPATSTSFGSFPAAGGTTGGNCKTSSQTSGSDGDAATGIEKLVSTGGKGAPGVGQAGASAAKVNGENGTGYGAGGGGGAIFYTSTPTYNNSLTEEQNSQPIQNGSRKWYQGTGGNGTNGLIVISW